ncbi:MAG: efflux RND transporter permease subunit [Planctomycetota bacterium]
MNLARFSVRNPVTANLLMWAIIAGGLYSAFNLRREMFPNVDSEAVAISVRYPGATPEEVERLVARRIEREVEGIEDVDEIISQVFEGLVTVTIKLEDGADREKALSDVRSAMDTVRPELPAEAEEPEIKQLRPTLPVIGIVAHGDVSEERLRRAIRKIRDDLEDLPGITDTIISGTRDREIWIEIRPEALEENGLTFEDVGRVLAGSNLDLPAGQLKSSVGNIRVRTLGERSRANEIENIPVKSLPGGTMLLLRDIAEVRETFEDTVAAGRYQGERAALCTVFKAPEEDAVQIAGMVKQYQRDHETMLGGALKLSVTRDLSRFIEQRLDLMLRNAAFGLALVILTLAIFLELRIAFWVAAGLMISFLGTFLVMYTIDETLNLISMFGLIVVLGLLVDDAIVVAENVFARRRDGLPAGEAAEKGTNEVARPVVAAIATTMVAFAPLAFLDGRLGAFLGVLPTVVICALGVSLFEAFVVLPAHLGHTSTHAGGTSRLARFAARVGAARERVLEQAFPAMFGRTLRVALKWRYVTVSLIIALVFVAVGFFQGGFTKIQFLGEVDAETMEVNLEMTPGTSEEETARVLADLEVRLRAQPEVKSCFTVLGTLFRDGKATDVADPATVGQITVEMVAADTRLERGMRKTRAVANQLRRETTDITGVRSLRFIEQAGGPQGADVEIRLRGDDLAQVSGATDTVSAAIGKYDGITEISDDLVEGKLELRYRLMPSAHTLGLTTADIARQVRHALFGFEVQDLQDEDEEVTVRVLLPESERTRIEDLSRLRMATPSGARVPLGEVADLETARGYATLTRVDGKRAFTVQATIDPTRANANELTTSLEQDLKGLNDQYPAVGWSFEGQKADMAESMGGLKKGFLVALGLIYVIVAILFRSYTQPILVMSAIPISFLGVVFGHVVLGLDLTLLSLIGSVALAGVVVNDSLILVDLINRRRGEGMPLNQAVREGSKQRLRAILLTSITTIAGLAPLMMERSFQAQFLIPMAVSMVFGLAFATVLTLVFVPSMYLILEDVRRRVRHAWRWIVHGTTDRAALHPVHLEAAAPVSVDTDWGPRSDTPPPSRPGGES